MTNDDAVACISLFPTDELYNAVGDSGVVNFSTKTRYALQMLVDMAYYGTECNVKVKDVAHRQGISVKYLEQIITVLVKGGLVKGERGPQGGYRLSMSPDRITAGLVYRLMEGSDKTVEQPANAECKWIADCLDIGLWTKVDDAISGIMDRTSISDLLDLAHREGLMDRLDAPEYYI